MRAERKLNIPVVMSVVLLGLVLISSHFVFSMFARYIVTAGDSDSARVAGASVISIHEHKAQRLSDGSYELGSEEVVQNSYVLLPGLDIPKDPFIRVGDTAELSAYLYAEIVDDFSDKLSYAVDDKWTKLTDVKGSHGGDVYVYDTSADIGGEEINILKDKKVTVSDALNTKYSDLKSGTGSEPETVLSFYGYLIQRSPDKTYTQLFRDAFAG